MVAQPCNSAMGNEMSAIPGPKCAIARAGGAPSAARLICR